MGTYERTLRSRAARTSASHSVAAASPLSVSHSISATRHRTPRPLFFVSAFVFATVISVLLFARPRLSSNRHILSYTSTNFTLDDVPIRLISGSVHYFRTLPIHWRRVLYSARLMGLNAIETYIPWNLHEPVPGEFVFSGILDLAKFLTLAQEEGLLVLLRPGPYICSEWDLGGLPAYLLAHDTMQLRSMHPHYMHAVNRYFDAVANVIRPFIGRPVVAIQIENEYGAYGNDSAYMHALKTVWETRGFRRPQLMFFTSDNGGPSSILKGSPFDSAHVLKTINLETNVARKVKALREIQPNAPVFIAEFWTGWFDHYGEPHHKRHPKDVVARVREILYDHDGNVNLYMFFGGTNFGYMAGANWDSAKQKYLAITTSYDYDAFIREDGNIRGEKFYPMQRMLRKFWTAMGNEQQLRAMNRQKLPPLSISAYTKVRLTEGLPLFELLHIAADRRLFTKYPISMEKAGASYGYMLYRHNVSEEFHKSPSYRLWLRVGPMRDFAYIMADGVMIGKGKRNHERYQDSDSYKLYTVPRMTRKLDILVENRGRVNYGREIFQERKGLIANVTLNGKILEGFECIPISFPSRHPLWPGSRAGDTSDTLGRLSNFLTNRYEPPKFFNQASQPALFRGFLSIGPGASKVFNGQLPGTYVRVLGDGVLWVNGFNVGTFHTSYPSPKRMLFIPAGLLQEGKNEFAVFHQNMYLVRNETSHLTMFARPFLGEPVVKIYDSRREESRQAT